MFLAVPTHPSSTAGTLTIRKTSGHIIDSVYPFFLHVLLNTSQELAARRCKPGPGSCDDPPLPPPARIDISMLIKTSSWILRGCAGSGLCPPSGACWSSLIPFITLSENNGN
jgi:hypothetical protein